MSTSFLHRALRRALLLSLAVPAIADQSACGGKVVLDEGSGGSFGVGGRNTSVGAGGSTGGCTLLSTTPTSVVNGGCQVLYELSGPASDCSPDSFGTLTPAQCSALCPPNPGARWP